MIAFHADGKNCVKAYLHGTTDWRLIDDTGREQWYSVWSSDVKGSLHSAFIRFLGRDVKKNEIAGMADKMPI
jgi:hypothetical protein